MAVFRVDSSLVNVTEAPSLMPESTRSTAVSSFTWVAATRTGYSCCLNFVSMPERTTMSMQYNLKGVGCWGGPGGGGGGK